MVKATLQKLLIALLFFPVWAGASDLKLIAAPIDSGDVASLQSGARTFVNYCLNCHSAGLVRYNQLKQLGLTEAQIKDNLLFTGEKVGELMKIAGSTRDLRDWFGAVPPDLSVIARSRGVDWLYNYLLGFYRDPERPTGWNNTVFKDVGMPHVLWQLQGERVMKVEVEKDAAGKDKLDGHGHPIKVTSFEQLTPGSMTTRQYEQTVLDLVNFLNWMGEPQQFTRRKVGYYVLIALGILIFLTYMLKRAYWRDVH